MEAITCETGSCQPGTEGYTCGEIHIFGLLDEVTDYRIVDFGVSSVCLSLALCCPGDNSNMCHMKYLPALRKYFQSAKHLSRKSAAGVHFSFSGM